MKECRKLYFPGWLFAPLVILYGELLLSLWTNDTLSFYRLALIGSFALGSA